MPGREWLSNCDQTIAGLSAGTYRCSFSYRFEIDYLPSPNEYFDIQFNSVQQWQYIYEQPGPEPPLIVDGSDEFDYVHAGGDLTIRLHTQGNVEFQSDYLYQYIKSISLKKVL